jgi:acyl-coenzyme A thioesterase PaaI-like protein
VDASSRASRPASVTIAGRPFPIRPHNCFACGSTNVAGLGLALHVEGDTCWTELELPDRFEGWQGIAHGGIVATILDEVMAWSLVDRDAWGLTARMSVDFKRPVPIGRRIRGEGRLVDRRRRLLRTSARLVDVATGDLLATAEGTYLAAPDERKRILKRTYGFDAEDVPAPASTGPSTAAIEGPE